MRFNKKILHWWELPEKYNIFVKPNWRKKIFKSRVRAEFKARYGRSRLYNKKEGRAGFTIEELLFCLKSADIDKNEFEKENGILYVYVLKKVLINPKFPIDLRATEAQKNAAYILGLLSAFLTKIDGGISYRVKTGDLMDLMFSSAKKLAGELNSEYTYHTDVTPIFDILGQMIDDPFFQEVREKPVTKHSFPKFIKDIVDSETRRSPHLIPFLQGYCDSRAAINTDGAIWISCTTMEKRNIMAKLLLLAGLTPQVNKIQNSVIIKRNAQKLEYAKNIGFRAVQKHEKITSNLLRIYPIEELQKTLGNDFAKINRPMKSMISVMREYFEMFENGNAIDRSYALTEEGGDVYDYLNLKGFKFEFTPRGRRGKKMLVHKGCVQYKVKMKERFATKDKRYLAVYGVELDPMGIGRKQYRSYIRRVEIKPIDTKPQDLPKVMALEKMIRARDFELKEVREFDSNAFYIEQLVFTMLSKMLANQKDMTVIEVLEKLYDNLRNINIIKNGNIHKEERFYKALTRIFSKNKCYYFARYSAAIYLNKKHDIIKTYEKYEHLEKEIAIKVLFERTNIAYSSLGEVLRKYGFEKAAQAARVYAIHEYNQIVERYKEYRNKQQLDIATSIMKTHEDTELPLYAIGNVLNYLGFYNESLIAKGLYTDKLHKISEMYLGAERNFPLYIKKEVPDIPAHKFIEMVRERTGKPKFSVFSICLALLARAYSLANEIIHNENIPPSIKRKVVLSLRGQLMHKAEVLAHHSSPHLRKILDDMKHRRQIPSLKVQSIWVCPECGYAGYEKDIDRAEYVCLECGFVEPFWQIPKG